MSKRLFHFLKPILRGVSGFFSAFTFIFLLLVSAYSHANTEDSGKLLEFLAQEKINLTIANNDLKQTIPPIDQHTLIVKKQQNEAMISLMQAKIINFESFLANQKKQAQKLSQDLHKLQQSPLDKSEEIGIQEKVSRINNVAAVNNKGIELIKENLELARTYVKNLEDLQRSLDLLQAKFEEERQIEQIRNRIQVLKQTRQDLYQKNIESQRSRKTDSHFASNLQYEAKLLYNNQLIVLIQHKISELELKKKIIKVNFELLKNNDVKTLQNVIAVYKTVLNHLKSIELDLNEILNLINNEKNIVVSSYHTQFNHLEKTLQTRIKDLRLEQEALNHNVESKQLILKKQLAQRQSLTEYQWQNWSLLFLKVIKIPLHFYNYLKPLLLQVKDNYRWQDFWPKVIFWLSISVLLGLFVGLNRLLNYVTQDKERSRLTAHLYDGFLVLLHRNIPHLTLLTGLLITFHLNRIPFSHYQLLINIFMVWFAFRNLILIARLMLLERLSDVSGEDVKFYYRLKWLFLFGGWSTVLMVFSHQLPLSSLLQDIFNRLFMIFLLAVSFVAWKSKEVIPYLLEPYLSTKRRYIHTAIKTLNILIPMTLFSTAVIGLIGYFNLAWSLSLYQIYFLLVITSYVLARGLIFDALELLSVWMISSLQNGWLWIEVILKPLDNIFRLILISFGVFILFQFFGWNTDSWVVNKIVEIGRYPFINIAGVHITLFSTGEFIFLIFCFIWLSKWTREFSYRWLYRKSKDAGVRNSLSVFTQYAVVLLGGFISLRTLGLDFSGMSMVLGGLAVGMGFGLRDFASNIVGGLMLLIERPVREGDLITLGEYEGKVAHIGIRSMRVSSWDNTEVLIPNAETFSKPFTNWTHQDSIVRTLVPLKVSRKDDPVMVQQLVLDVLADIPEIVTEPSPQVLLKKIDEALIEFEIRYFINVEIHTRFEIRSKVLFAIMSQFAAAGIKAPIPPISVELNEGETKLNVVPKKSTSQ